MYSEGEVVDIWADVDPQSEIVLGWGPDGQLLDAPNEWNGRLVMPPRDVALAADIAPVAVQLTPRSVSLGGSTREIRVATASSGGEILGGVLFFHGASYNVDQILDNAASTTVMHLVRAGLLVIAVPSEASSVSGTGGWDASLDMDDNVDLKNTAALIDLLRADGTLPESVPLAAWGMSSGGYYAHTVGAAGLVDVVVAHCAPGNADAIEATSAPTGWYLASADTVVPTGASSAESFREALTARGIPTDLYIHPQTPLYDERFTRVLGISLSSSIQIAASLRDNGAVDSDGAWQVSGGDVIVDVAGIEGEKLSAVKAEIEIMAADHELYDDAAAQMTAFVVQHLLGER